MGLPSAVFVRCGCPAALGPFLIIDGYLLRTTVGLWLASSPPALRASCFPVEDFVLEFCYGSCGMDSG